MATEPSSGRPPPAQPARGRWEGGAEGTGPGRPPRPPRPPAAAAGPSPRLTLGSSCSHVALGTGGGAGPGPGSCELEPAAVAARGGERGRRRRRSGLMDARRASAHPAGEVRPGQGAGFHAGPRRAALPAGRVTVCALCGGDSAGPNGGASPRTCAQAPRGALCVGTRKGPLGVRGAVCPRRGRGTLAKTKGGCGISTTFCHPEARGDCDRDLATLARPTQPLGNRAWNSCWEEGGGRGASRDSRVSAIGRPAFGHQHGEFML